MTGPATILATHRRRVASDAVGETYQVDVALPEAWAAARAPGPLPVVYVMDGNTTFGIAAQAARFLQNAGEMPAALVVGVGYELEGPRRERGDYGALRTRDLTPSLDAEFFEKVRADGWAEDIAPPGGADQFLDFLVDELRPFLASRYDVDLGDQTLVGSSLGGLFALHALFNRPGAFQRTVANSPALWWDDRRLFSDEARFATSGQELRGRVFLSVGGLETTPPWNMVEDLQRFARLLRERSYPALSLSRHLFEGESHTSVIPAALARGMREVFADVASGLPSGLASA